jgi:hypothetical protein
MCDNAVDRFFAKLERTKNRSEGKTRTAVTERTVNKEVRCKARDAGQRRRLPASSSLSRFDLDVDAGGDGQDF